MSLPLVTRFGADPLLDLEVANKRYVDNSSGGAGGKFFFTVRFAGFTGGTLVFFGDPQYEVPYTTTEAQRHVLIQIAFDVTRVTCNCLANTRSGDSIYGLRDDGVTSGIITIPAGITGNLDSGVLSDSYASGSLVNSIIDVSGAGSGTIQVIVAMIECTPT